MRDRVVNEILYDNHFVITTDHIDWFEGILGVLRK